MIKYKLMVEAPGASFEREFSTLKALTQFKRRNPSIIATSFVLYNNDWERFAVYKSCILTASTLLSLLKSLNIEAPDASPTNLIPDNSLI